MFVYVVPTLAIQAPLLLSLLVGVVLAVAFWRRSPRASGLALGGFVMALVASLVGNAPNIATITLGLSAAQIQPYLMAISLATAVWRGASYLLLLLAVYADRRREARGFPVEPLRVRPVNPA
jgi:hypothetical protein